MKLQRRAFFKQSVAGLAVLPFFASTKSYAAPMGKARFVDVDGIRTSYFEGGSGEPMVLVHGGHFGSTVSANCWRPIFDHLASHFHVYVVDKLGQGYTDNPESDAHYSMEAVIQHLYRFMKTLGLQNVHLVGHSRGALPAATVATEHPEMVENMILFNSRTLAPDDHGADRRPRAATPPPAAVPSPPTRESIRQSLLSNPSVFHKEYVTDDYVEGELRVALLPKRKEAEKKMLELTARWVKLNPEKVKENPRIGGRWWYDEVKRETLEGMKAGRLKAPTLLLWAHNDPPGAHTFGISLYNIISGVVERTQLHVFNHCGHYAFQEYPGEVTEQMVSFIKV